MGQEQRGVFTPEAVSLLDDVVTAGKLADLQERTHRDETRLAKIARERETLQRELVTEEEVTDALHKFDSLWNELSQREQARVLQFLIERIEYDGTDGDVSITFRQSGFPSGRRIVHRGASGLKIQTKVHIGRGRRGKREMRRGENTSPVPGRIPRVAKLMALAIRFDQLIRDDVVADYAELARLGQVSRARETQIMNLLNLATDIQERILSMPRVEAGRDPLTERELREVVAEVDWARQRRKSRDFN